MTRSHIVSLRRSVLCSHITSRSCRAETRSRRTNSAEDIWSFRILIDLVLWQILIRSEKLDSALFASMHARRIRCIIFFIDFSIISSFSHRIGIPYGLPTAKLHRDRSIDVARSIWELWDTMMLSDHGVICTLVNIAILRQKVLAPWCTF